jgi:hypothetical protein
LLDKIDRISPLPEKREAAAVKDKPKVDSIKSDRARRSKKDVVTEDAIEVAAEAKADEQPQPTEKKKPSRKPRRSVKTGLADDADKKVLTEKSELAEKGEKPAKTRKSQKAEKTEKPEKVESGEKNEKVERPKRRRRTAKPKSVEASSEQVAQVENETISA